MKNRSIENIKSKIRIAIKGKNVNRFLMRIHKNKIPILDIKKINKDEAYILVYFKDYDSILKLNTIYEIFIVTYGGWEYRKRKIGQNSFLIVGLIIGILLIFLLSKMIFKVEIVTNDTIMKEKILYELKRYDIEKFKFQKSYNSIQKIKESILNKYKEEIEWLEIELIGTKYLIKYEPRITNSKDEDVKPRHIVASKNAIVYSVISSKGQIVRYKNDYVSKGDIVVSGEIKLNDEVKEVVGAEGIIYGETWYEVEVFYPFGYYEQKKTGNTKDVYVVKFLNWRLELFNFNKFYDKIIKEDILLKNRSMPFSFVKEHQIEVETKTAISTVEEAKVEAINLGINKMKNKLEENEYIIKYKVIKEFVEEKGVRLSLFFSVCEDITEYVEIKEDKDE